MKHLFLRISLISYCSMQISLFVLGMREKPLDIQIYIIAFWVTVNAIIIPFYPEFNPKLGEETHE